jgi:metal-sulfur cluster biosynthetic enzyme
VTDHIAGGTVPAPTEDVVREALNMIEDPELLMGIVDLGLVYDIKIDAPRIHVTYSLTSMGCPVGPWIAEQVEETLRGLDGIDDVEAELTFSPPWTPEKMSEDAKFALGF